MGTSLALAFTFAFSLFFSFPWTCPAFPPLTLGGKGWSDGSYSAVRVEGGVPLVAKAFKDEMIDRGEVELILEVNGR